MARTFVAAAFLTLTALASMTGCTVGGEEEVTETVPEPYTKAQCRNIHQGYARCLQEANEEYRECIASAQRDLIADVIGDIMGALPIPCVGAALNGILGTRCIFTPENPVECIASNTLSVLSNIQEYKAFESCAADLGSSGPKGAAALKNFVKGAEAGVYMALAQLAAQTTKYVVRYDQCARSLGSDGDACEPVACNRAKCVCFDAPACPTLAKCGGSQTHMTGLVACGDIAGGRATTTDGRQITCTSYTNMAAPGVCKGQTNGACR